jgi:NMD protein affecting ribosome stability and mRNA decay
MGGRKSNKKYTNEAWTKRVDHEAGRHRAPRAPKEPAVCEVCGDVYAERRWIKPDAERKETKHKHYRPPIMTICPACQRQREGVASGFVHLDGAYLEAHREEIERLLHNEAERAAEDNPMARIMNWGRDERGRLTLSTTTEHLAQRLGHALEKAFSGRVRYDFSHENKLAHVYWHRD